MSSVTPSKNIHSLDLLERTSQIFSAKPTHAPSMQDLCALAMDLQTSLRAANCDSPRINSDPAFRLVMTVLDDRLKTRTFPDFSDVYSKMEKDLTEVGPVGQRAKWANMAQDGAVNLTPMTRSLLSAVTQINAEGGVPENDGSVRLLAHQMSFIAGTHPLTNDCAETKGLKAWCKAAQAAISVENSPVPTKALAP